MVDILISNFEKTRSSMALIGVFVLSIFLSATLLFSVQPMFAKLVLPLLGGASNVWNTAMVFFQFMLLGGYVYAHVISKYLKFNHQIVLHGAMLLFGCLFLPLSIAEGWTPPDTGAQTYWLIALFAVSVGAPFFAISANAPLLQRWFSRTDDKDADDPYFLYSASNAGSLLSLCLYPIVFEPLLKLQEQTRFWTLGYVALVFLIVGAGFFALRRQKVTVNSSVEIPRIVNSIVLQDKLMWIALAFIPSSLMLGVTSHMTNNISSAPFLWILPLALYLLTFIIVFSRKPIVQFRHLTYFVPVAIISALLFGFIFHNNFLLSISISLASYFIITLACHMRLAEARPQADNLTEFYIWMSFGGVLGGALNALVAPVIFNGVYEYVLVLGAACFACFKFSSESVDYGKRGKIFAEAIIISSLIFFILWVAKTPLMIILLCSGCYFSFKFRHLSNSPKFTLFSTLSVVLALSIVVPVLGQSQLYMDRSFFGILGVKSSETPHGKIHRFVHGDTVHNYQLQKDDLRKIPLAYYSKGNTFDRGLNFARSEISDSKLSVAMIGLGAGAMACYEKPEDNWVYFEIDPAVVQMAQNSKYFSYMEECSFDAHVIIGDARMKFLDIPLASQDYIIVDAFSSDSIPAHLLTVEALELYRSRLKPNGLIFFHTSNRVLDISSVVSNLAKNSNLDSRYIEITPDQNGLYANFESKSSAVMVGTHAQMDAIESFDANWKKRIPSPDVGLWSDDYSHIIGTLKAKYKNNAKILSKVRE